VAGDADQVGEGGCNCHLVGVTCKTTMRKQETGVCIAKVTGMWRLLSSSSCAEEQRAVYR
jgi:hypothetical protein